MEHAMFAQNPKSLARMAGGLVCLVGLVVLLGWALDLAPLKSVFPGLITMKANTAVNMALCGTALALVSKRAAGATLRWVVATLALAAIVLAALTMGEYLFEWNLGIDQFLFKDEIESAGTFPPGRMSPATAFCFIITVIGLWTESQQFFPPTAASGFVRPRHHADDSGRNGNPGSDL